MPSNGKPVKATYEQRIRLLEREIEEIKGSIVANDRTSQRSREVATVRIPTPGIDPMEGLGFDGYTIPHIDDVPIIWGDGDDVTGTVGRTLRVYNATLNKVKPGLAMAARNQDGRWYVIPTGCGCNEQDYSCCDCEYSDLYVSFENSNLTYEKITEPKSNVSGGLITHRIRVFCNTTSPPQSTVIELSGLDCTQEDCKTLDLTGSYVGDCEIGIIYYGNQASCTIDDGDRVPCDGWIEPQTATGSGTAPPQIILLGGQYDVYGYVFPKFPESIFRGSSTFNVPAVVGKTEAQVVIQFDTLLGRFGATVTYIDGDPWQVITPPGTYIILSYGISGTPQGFQSIQLPFDHDSHTLRVESKLDQGKISTIFDGIVYDYDVSTRTQCVADGMFGAIAIGDPVVPDASVVVESFEIGWY
jgi:hypothetical protein